MRTWGTEAACYGLLLLLLLQLHCADLQDPVSRTSLHAACVAVSVKLSCT